MRNAGLTLVAIALASCGRLDFDDLRDGGSRIDAPIAMLDSGTTDGTTDGSVMLSDAATDRANFIFMSSGTTTSGNLGGLAGADAFCQSAATTGGLTGTYVAMLMTSASNSSARFVGSRGWVDLHGKPIADQPSDLDGANLNPLAVDELGNTYSGASAYAWVGQHTSGTCMDWTSSADTTSVLAIDSSSTFNPDGFLGCSFTNARLICAEVGHVAPVVPAIATGRIAFITAASWMPGGGIGDADALCESEATSAGLVTGSYLAFLATSTATALRRLNIERTIQFSPWFPRPSASPTWERRWANGSARALTEIKLAGERGRGASRPLNHLVPAP